MLSELKEILAKVKADPTLAAHLEDDADLIGEVGLDSLEMLEFMLEVESHAGVELAFERLDFESLRSLREFAAQIEQVRLRP